jgi:hypothetical protein
MTPETGPLGVGFTFQVAVDDPVFILCLAEHATACQQQACNERKKFLHTLYLLNG